MEKSFLLSLILLSFCIASNGEHNKTEVTLGKTFFVSSDKANFFQAYFNCKDGAMDLASINTQQDEEDLTYFLRNVDKSANPISNSYSVSKKWYKNDLVGRNTMSTWTQNVARKAGLKLEQTKSNHSSGASAVSNLAKSGVGEEQLIEIMGHASTSSIRPYLQLDYEHHENIVKKMRGEEIQELSSKALEGSPCLEVTSITKKVQPEPTTRNSAGGFWLSGTNLNNKNSTQFYWLTGGKRVIYTNWLAGEPNNSGGQEFCLEWAEYVNNATASTGWNDYNCDLPLRYICQKTE